jgi:hypothetical protein
MAIGRITGPMLFSNLDRQGVNLAIDGNLIYADVTNRRVGIGNATPQYTLDVTGNVQLGNIVVYNNSISSTTGKIDLGSISGVTLTGGSPDQIIYTDGNGNLAFGSMALLAGLEGFTANNIIVGTVAQSHNGFGTSALTTGMDVATAINTLDNILGNITNSGGNLISVTGNITGSYLFGTIGTTSQPNINTVGPLTNLVVSGNLTVLGNTILQANTTINGHSQLTIFDGIINLHTDAALDPWAYNDESDIGIKIHYYDYTDSAAFLGRANNTGYLEWYDKGTDVANVFVGTSYGTIKSGALLLANARSVGGGLSANTGAMQVWGDGSVSGNLYVGGTFTGAGASFSSINNTPVGNAVPSTGAFTTLTSTTLTTSANIRSGNVLVDTISPYQTAVTVFNSNTAIQVPIGNTTQRPTGVNGYLRFNTDTPAIEYFDGTAWIPVTNTVTDQTIYPDGSNSTYTLIQPSTGAGVIVSINGTVQNPTLAYTVAGNQITFTEVPQVTDIIDVRFLGASVTINNTLSDNLLVSGNVTVGGILQLASATKSSTAVGTPGQVSWDANYFYICTATNTWKRTPLTGGY